MKGKSGIVHIIAVAEHLLNPVSSGVLGDIRGSPGGRRPSPRPSHRGSGGLGGSHQPRGGEEQNRHRQSQGRAALRWEAK